MEHKKQNFKIQWVLLLLSAPIVIALIIWFSMQSSKPEAWFASFNSEKTLIYRGYPLVTNLKQEQFLSETKYKSVWRQPFYLDPMRPDLDKVLALVSFLSDSSNHDPERVAKKCAFHADLMLEIGGYPFGKRALICTSCSDVWLGTTASSDTMISIRSEKTPELRKRVLDILGKPAEWPPELQD